MPSRSNPNTPTSQKRKAVRALQAKRDNTTRRLLRDKIAKNPIPRTSQAIRRAAPPSQKKLRKLERKQGYLRRRKMEEMGEVGEVVMRDVGGGEGGKKNRKKIEGEVEVVMRGDGDVAMDVEEPGVMMEIDEVRGDGEEVRNV